MKAILRFILSHKKIFIPSLSALVLLCGAFIFLGAIGPWLLVSDPVPSSLDCVFTFGGDIDRMAYGEKLFRDNPSSLWICSMGRGLVMEDLTLGEMARRHLAGKGLDTSRIIVNDSCTSTAQELDMLCAKLSDGTIHRYLGKDPSSTLRVGLVSSAFHTRRIMLTAHKKLAGQPLSLYSLPVPHYYVRDPVHLRAWWRNENHANAVIGEIIKLAYYAWRNYF